MVMFLLLFALLLSIGAFLAGFTRLILLGRFIDVE